jgi:Glyoxalase/Bleomycin resistance protein/Dioxygenase superfamily
MNFQGVVMNMADLDRSIDFYREVLGFTLLSQEEQLAAVVLQGATELRSSCCERLGAILLEELATLVCEPSYWKSSQSINWNGSPAIWTLGDFSSARVNTASGWEVRGMTSPTP